jgi:hypothetical protein
MYRPTEINESEHVALKSPAAACESRPDSASKSQHEPGRPQAAQNPKESVGRNIINERSGRSPAQRGPETIQAPHISRLLNLQSPK